MDTSDIISSEIPRFYSTYLTIASEKVPDIDPEAIALLRNRGFSKFIIENEDPVDSVKMLSYVMSHSMLKPQRLLVDHDDYYIAIDLFTNTYYICYRDLMMIDIDRYKQDIEINTLEDIKKKLTAHPELFFRIYSSRNGYHLFIINKSMDYKSDNSIRLMSELGCDFYYIVYSYLRGWSVRLNKKKGEENINNLYMWVGDVVKGHFFSSSIMDNLSEDFVTTQLTDLQTDNSLTTQLIDVQLDNSLIKQSADVQLDNSLMKQSADIQLDNSILLESILPDERLEELTHLHIRLVDIFKDVGLCSMPAPK